jgi:tetratricopeptide (TPR) repeat protein
MISWIGTSLAEMYFAMGNMNQAVLLLEESVTLDRKAGNMPHLPVSIGNLGSAYQILGEWDKTEEYLKEALSISQRLNEFQNIGGSYWLLGELHRHKEEYVKARDFYEKALEAFEKAGAKTWKMSISAGVIFACIELGEIEKAKKLINNVHKFALQVKDKGLIATADVLRAMQFRAQKKWKQSIERFEKSFQEHEALDARRWNVYNFAKYVLFEYARVYLEKGKEGDREKAHDLLNQALEIFQKIGAKKEIEKTESRLAYLETGRQVTKLEPDAEAALPSLITTGYEDLDGLLHGGIPRNYAVVLTSPSCDERDLLVRRFLEAGTKEGQITFYVITKASGIEYLAEEFPSNFYLFVCNPQAGKIIKTLPNVFKLKGVENLTDINIALISAFRKLDATPKAPRRICIEIISDVLLQHHTVQTRKWINALIPELKSKGFTTLAVLDPEIHSQQEVRAIVGVFEGEINIHDKETKEGLKKHLKIRKMTNQKYSESELRLSKEKLQR